ncbi:MAG: hypothetical protein ABW224_26570 [Kibdelosporangium sp.]
MSLTDLIDHLRERRPMYVLDDHYLTLVAFIDGYNSAHAPQSPLRDFGTWLAHRLTNGPSSLHWAAQVAAIQGGRTIQDLTFEQEQVACAHALNLIDEFLER